MMPRGLADDDHRIGSLPRFQRQHGTQAEMMQFKRGGSPFWRRST